MNTKNPQGRMIGIIVGVYFIAKVLLNMVLGDGLNILELILDVAETAVLYAGLIYSNYVVAAIAVIIVLRYLPGNLKDISAHIVHLLEGGLDVLCAFILCFASSVREHCSNKPSDIFGGNGN